ncbi:MAG: hypothetical protein FWF22_00280 [Treponema sp.]|nr:hypothetical protein [Treponema sp.]
MLIIFISCALTKNLYLGSNDYSQRPGTPSEEELGTQNINGYFPDQVYIKTRTQTFNVYHYYILSEGRIWYKSIDPDTEPKDWTLFDDTGLPHRSLYPGFKNPAAITEISADADELVAVSAEGNFYRYCFDPILTRKSKVWFDRQGWPTEEQLYFDTRTSNNLSWSLGKRNNHVLYTEDIFGNQHNNGLLEIATIYVLLNDGQEICYADSGLPSDFSRNFIGPERGKFISAALSASASTMFVINDVGEMYTRLADFDVTGSNPMGFEYTYVPFKSDLPGTKYASNNQSDWGLPGEDWRSQPRIPLSGKAAITGFITILQNGQGNSARELRVAGLNEEGKTGFWTKQLFDDTWEFKTVPLFFARESILAAANPDETGLQEEPCGLRGSSMDKSYSGFQWNGKEMENGWQYEIPDFNILEGDCDFRVTWQGETCTLKLFPVEMWSYLQRDYLPGRTGPPKMYLTTLEVPENALDSLSDSFKEQITEKFVKYDREIFHYTIAASNSFIIMRELDNADTLFYLTDGSISSEYSELNTGSYIQNFNEVQRYYSQELAVGSNAVFTAADLKEKTALNKQFIKELDYKIRVSKWAQLTAFEINAGYLPGHFISKMTPLRFIPKIRIVTTFGEKLVLANNAYVETITNSSISLYSKIIEMLNTRILCYNDLIKESSKSGKTDIVLPPWYSDNIADYWSIGGLPEKIQGYFAASGGRTAQIPATLTVVHSSPSGLNISGWFIAIEGSSNYSFFIESDNSAKTIYQQKGKLPKDKKLQFNCIISMNDSANTEAEQEIMDNCLRNFFDKDGNIHAKISYDGKTFEIREFPSKHPESLIFSGTTF